jgi:hypothetical protein
LTLIWSSALSLFWKALGRNPRPPIPQPIPLVEFRALSIRGGPVFALRNAISLAVYSLAPWLAVVNTASMVPLWFL